MLPEWFRNCSLHLANLLPWCGRYHGGHVSGGGVVVAKGCVAKIMMVVTVMVECGGVVARCNNIIWSCASGTGGWATQMVLTNDNRNATATLCMAASPVVLLNCCHVAATWPHSRPWAHLSVRPLTLLTRTVPRRAARFPPICTATTRRPLGQRFVWVPNVHVQPPPSGAVPLCVFDCAVTPASII